jgi:hypothetical protein
MTPAELTNTIKQLEEQLSITEKEKLDSESAILRQKINLAKSYLIDPQTIAVGALYRVKGVDGLFQVAYLNGIYAWGTFDGKSEKEAFPLSLLENK